MPQDLVDAITEVYSSLQKEGIEDYDIMIDVTGGTETPCRRWSGRGARSWRAALPVRQHPQLPHKSVRHYIS